MMQFTPRLFDGAQWRTNQSLRFRDEGLTRVSPQALDPARPTPMIPGMTNVHSHAFQAGFAGLCESRGEGEDDFWTWRKRMFHFLEDLTPETMYRVARDAYRRMLLAGYTAVCEFHYVHHDPG